MERREQKQTSQTIQHPSTSLPGPTPPTITTTCLASQPPQPHYRCLTTHTRSWGWVVKHPPTQPPHAVGWHLPHRQAKTKGVGPGHKPTKTQHPQRQARDTIRPTQSPLPRGRLQPDRDLSAVQRRRTRRGAAPAWRPATRAPCGSLSESCLPKNSPNARALSDLLALRMSPSASRVGLECMATLVTTRTPYSDRSSAHTRRHKSAPDASAERYPTAARSPHPDDRDDAATNAVATAFARIVAGRYPGTSWLPVKSSRSDDPLVVPAGKVVRLLPGPADMDTRSGIGHPAAPAAYERAPHEHGADTRAQ